MSARGENKRVAPIRELALHLLQRGPVVRVTGKGNEGAVQIGCDDPRRYVHSWVEIFHYDPYRTPTIAVIRRGSNVFSVTFSLPMTFSNDPEADSHSARERSLIVFGELLFDCFEDGTRRMGGAPFNVAWALQGFGATPLFVSAIGQDEDGDAILDCMDRWNLADDGLREIPDFETGTADVRFDGDGPSYAIHEPQAWDMIEDEGFLAVDLFYHGSLALRSEVNRTTLSAIDERSRGLRFYDVNLRPPHTSLMQVRTRLRGADWTKLNLEELRAITGLPQLSLQTADSAIDRFCRDFDVGTVLLTAGSDGARIRGSYGDAMKSPAPSPDEVIDTVGAGDAFTAVALYGILHAWSAEAILQKGGAFAAKVCALQGATTDQPEFYQL